MKNSKHILNDVVDNSDDILNDCIRLGEMAVMAYIEYVYASDGDMEDLMAKMNSYSISKHFSEQMLDYKDEIRKELNEAHKYA